MRYEPLKITKRRNQQYYYMSKRLKELVQVFGRRNSPFGGYSSYNFHGPYYSGISFLASFPAYKIRLCSPTSTTDQIEIATKFAGGVGVVVTFMNDLHDNRLWMRRYESSYISAFPEESETIFISGYHQLSITNILSVETAKEYRIVTRALRVLNSMISGNVICIKKENHRGRLEWTPINALEKRTLLTLISESLKLSLDEKVKIDKYGLSCFQSFIQNQRNIVLNFAVIGNAFSIRYSDQDLYKLFMEKIDKQTMWRQGWKQIDVVVSSKAESKCNIPKSSLFKVFANTTELHIITQDQDDIYPFSFHWLLESIKEAKNLDLIKIHCETKSSWIALAWSKYENELVDLYKKNKFKMIFVPNKKQTAHGSYGNKDYIIISKCD